MVQLNNDGLLLDEEDLSTISPAEDDHSRIYLHNGNSEISTGNGEKSSEPGLYLWNQTDRVWHPAGRYSEILNGFRSEDLAKQSDFSTLESKHDTLKIDHDGLQTDHDDLRTDHDSLNTSFGNHETDTTNPHNVDYSQVGSYSVSDADSEFLTRSGDSLLGDLDINSNDLLDGTTKIWDTLNQYVPLSSLQEDSTSVVAGTNLSGGGTVQLGDSITLNIDDGKTSGLVAQEAAVADNALELGNNLPSHYAVDSDLQGHKQDTTNPHDVTNDQVSAPSDTEFGNHTSDNSAHHTRYEDSEARLAVDGADVSILGGASATQSNLTDHEGDTTNPHSVTATQAGAPTETEHNSLRTDFDSHDGDLQNPHGVTTAQISAINQDQLAVAGGVATLDSSSTVPDSQLPSLAISETFVVLDETERLALTAQKGDIAVQEDVSNSYILKGDDPSVSSNWTELKTPESPVQSVLGRTGNITAESGDYTHSQIGGQSTDDHHTRYADSEAIAAINGEVSLSVDITGDADTVDGNDASAFATSGHTHSQLHDKYTDEEAQDAIGLNVGNALSYNDTNGTVSVTESEISHDNISGVSSSDHHAKYTDSEARLAVDGAALSIQGVANSTQSDHDTLRTDFDSHITTYNSHDSDNSAHHTRYADSEARGAIESGNVSQIQGDGGLKIDFDSTNDRIEFELNGSRTEGLFSRVYLDNTNTWFEGNHSDLSGISSDDHHTRYADSEARSAVDGSSVSITGSAGSTQTDVDNHIGDTTNPHSVTPSQIGAITSPQSDNIYVGSTAPTSPAENDIWIRTS